DANLNANAVTSPKGETTTLTYDSAGNLQQATAPASLQNAQKSFRYNARNDPTQVTDARGKVTLYTYTPPGNVETVTQHGMQAAPDLLGHVTPRNACDRARRVLSRPAANTRQTTCACDAANRLRSATGPDPGNGNGRPVTRSTYADAGNKLRETGPDPDGAGP